MRAEVVKIGEGYAVELIIADENFRVKYFAAHRVDPLRDARNFAHRIGKAVKREQEIKGEK